MTAAHADLPDAVRCTWVKANGSRCRGRRTAPYPEARWCDWHESRAVARQQWWNTAENLGTVADFSVEEHLMMELRMSIIQLKELEGHVIDLGLSMDAWLTETTETEERSGDAEAQNYVSSKRAQLLGAHPVVVQFLKEREHHMNIIKLCVQAGLAAKQLAILERYVESLIESQMELARALGHDPNDAVVRQAIMEVVRRKQSELGETRELKEITSNGPIG